MSNGSSLHDVSSEAIGMVQEDCRTKTTVTLESVWLMPILDELKDRRAAAEAVEAKMAADKAAFDEIDGPAHYGGRDNPYEVIKIIDALELGFDEGNTLKYMLRHRHKGDPVKDLQKAIWYLNHRLEKVLKAAKPAA